MTSATTTPLAASAHDHFFLGTDHQRNERKVWLVIVLTASMMLVEIIAGTIYGWRKNQNITSASLAGQQLVDALKKEGVVNGVSAAKSAALSAAAAVAKTTPKTAAESAESTDTDDTVADSAFEPGGDGQ